MQDTEFSWVQAAILVFTWTLYFIHHSLLADTRVRQRLQSRWPAMGRHYRLLYTLQSAVLILIPLFLLVIWYGKPLWAWEGWMGWIADGLALLGLLGFAVSTRAYDMAAFLGLKTETASANATGFQLSPAHRFVRHPWYFFGLLILWTRDMPPALLLSAVCITLYLVVGSRLEERKLIEEFGDRYRQYRRQVPGLLPRPWRFLSAAQARRLTE